MTFDQLESFLWVIPGVAWIYYYNTFTPHKKITISGWPYLFTIVIIASILKLPDTFLNIDLLTEQQEHLKKFMWLFKIILYIFLLWLPKIEWIKQFLPQIEDNFYDKCTKWHKKAVLLTLKNGKVYVGVLSKYPDNPNLRYESQTIFIIPSFSGYREQEKKRIEWTTHYPTGTPYADMELIIPRSEIVTFCKFNQEAHNYFEEIKEFNKKYPYRSTMTP
ncbi:MAG: hypothetical protein OXK80_02350 [Bdellovibrionales bacterium]|nr:hypothetical protein [Bdellovibrionales bacterium]